MTKEMVEYIDAKIQKDLSFLDFDFIKSGAKAYVASRDKK